MLSAELLEFARSPGAYLDATGTEVVDNDRYFAAIVAGGKYVNVFRPSFALNDAAEILAEVRALAPSATGSWQTDSRDLADALVAAGARRPAPPLEFEFVALATATAPPAVDGIDVRRVESFDDYLVGLEIALSAEQYTDEVRARRRAEAEATWERRRSGPAMEWLASIDGEPVAHARAFPGPRGFLLDGGATTPSARGHGAYRALIAARWHEAVARGTPALVVQAGEMSRPILERCGFEVVCTMYEAEHDPL
ncbi:MAG TPA: GNAT family N-acetyltransferase [Gaiellaceae bacterium]|nr:GNAT family N-acetyltransferase [Gaiellaceae bacterium]